MKEQMKEGVFKATLTEEKDLHLEVKNLSNPDIVFILCQAIRSLASMLETDAPTVYRILHHVELLLDTLDTKSN